MTMNNNNNDAAGSAEELHETIATPEVLMDPETIRLSQDVIGRGMITDFNKRLLANTNRVIKWREVYSIAINEFSENGKRIRIATPLRAQSKYKIRQFSFGAFDMETKNIILFFNAGQTKAKSRSEAFKIFKAISSYCDAFRPSYIPFAIKLI